MTQEKGFIIPEVIEEDEDSIIDFGLGVRITEGRLNKIVKNNNSQFRGQGIWELNAFLREEEIQGVNIKEMGIEKTEVPGVFMYYVSLWRANILSTIDENEKYVKACEDLEERIKEKARE